MEHHMHVLVMRDRANLSVNVWWSMLSPARLLIWAAVHKAGSAAQSGAGTPERAPTPARFVDPL